MDNAAGCPLVSVGLPVYNGERYLCQALDSLLAQDCRNLELIISDNASTDRTADICLDYAQRDGRIRYSRNSCNLGASANFRRVLDLASGTYFMWAAHDDVWLPSFISECLRGFEAQPEAALCYAWFHYIDSSGRVIDTSDPCVDLDLSSGDVRRRVRNYLRGGPLTAVAIYGLFKRGILQTLRIHDALGADLMMMMDLVLKASCAQVPKFLIQRRFPERDWETYLNGLFPHVSKPSADLSFSEVVSHWRHVIRHARLPGAVKTAVLLNMLSSVYVQPTRWRTRVCVELEVRLASALRHRRAREAALLIFPTIMYVVLEGRLKALLLPAIRRHWRRPLALVGVVPD